MKVLTIYEIMTLSHTVEHFPAVNVARAVMVDAGWTLKADLSGNIFYMINDELRPLGICIPELAQVAEIGGSDED